uniref:NADH-ubiquinone oxidoreductase chain 4 n=3 Tax=Sternaspis TaxID=36132 RepID=A0A6C0UG41_9ANNE|nr:NADH dehydrogenase subunit 4 [Sternaspis chinensis]YP_010580941.1 NADH dehydrogenase subunit 4 [Sternaspis liui]QIB72583.1 NADH dehydrogenase subunit 4 [Sternaspis scutata]UZT27139.1 NADH dehydrogenase subunit 4 [Sternaspis chinensis]UZT27152.1 NADH dehydrogenase subunit 4 [Sternaspis liui]
MLKMMIPILSLLLLLPYSHSNNNMKWHLPSFTLIIVTLLLFPLISIPFPFSPLNLFSIDLLNLPLIILTTWISSMMFMVSYLTLHNNNKISLFSMQIILLSLILVLSFSVNNFILFYVFFEASLIPTLLLIIGWGYQPERLQAGVYLMMYTVTASLPLLMSLLVIYKTNFHTSFSLTFWLWPHSSLSCPFWSLISVSAFMVKMPLFFVHLWLPKAHVEAPVAGSMILAGILLKLGSYGLIRISLFLFKMTKPIAPVFMSISLWGAVISSMICIRQQDLKSLIAYSSVGHMGLLTAGLMSNSKWGWQGSLAMMVAHGLCSSALFAIANMTYEKTNTRSLSLTKGMINIIPMMTFWWFILTASNMAAPPSINLMSEIILLTASLSKSIYFSLSIILISFLTATYSLHMFTASQHGPNNSYFNPASFIPLAHFTPLLLMTAPLVLLTPNLAVISSWN